MRVGVRVYFLGWGLGGLIGFGLKWIRLRVWGFGFSDLDHKRDFYSTEGGPFINRRLTLGFKV